MLESDTMENVLKTLLNVKIIGPIITVIIIFIFYKILKTYNIVGYFLNGGEGGI